MSDRLIVAYTVMQSWHRVPGGTATAVLDLARELSKRPDLDLVGIAPRFGRPPAEPFVPPIPLRTVPMPYQLAYDLWHHAPELAPARAFRGVDVVHATTVTVPPVGKAPLVVTVHDLFPVTHPEQFSSRGVRIMARGIDRARRLADMVCVPSEATRRDCLAHGFDDDRLRVVPWGASVRSVTDDQRREVRDRYRLERPYVLWVGTVEPRKNLPTLLSAFAQLDGLDADLVLVGPDGWSEDIDAQVAQIGPRVRRLGFVPAADLDALYAAASVLALPSLREGFGLPAVEAMAHGVPVVAGEGTAVAEVVGPGGRCVAVADAAAWAAALEELLVDEPQRLRLAGAARTQAATFSWERCAEQTAAVYHEVQRHEVPRHEVPG